MGCYLFSDASNFNIDITNWNVSNVIRMRSVFQDTPFNHNIGKWNIANLEPFGFGGSFFPPQLPVLLMI